MANVNIKDGAAASKYLKSSGAGTDIDPFIPEHLETNSAALLAAVDGIEALLTTMDADTSALAAAVSTEMQVDVVGALPAGSNVIGLVGTSDIVVTVTPTLDTLAYSSGDLLFDSTEVANAVRANGYCAVLQSVTLLDKADQKVAMTLVFLNAATDMGAPNSAPDPDDTEAATIIGWVPVATSDYIDAGANAVACVRNIGLTLKAGAAATSIYVAAINGTSAPTYGASDLVLQLGFLRS